MSDTEDDRNRYSPAVAHLLRVLPNVDSFPFMDRFHGLCDRFSDVFSVIDFLF